jgi:murein tripeptide amidase MpaA
MSYLNITEVESGLSGLASAYPALTGLITLPNTTHEGRTCHALRIGVGSPSTKDAVLFIGGVHAREWGSCEICINFAADLLEAYTLGTDLVYGGKSFTSAQIKSIVEDLHVFVFPLVNPDGRHYSQNVYDLWRKNRNPLPSSACEGVDINRNYDFIWDFPNLCSPPVPGWDNDVHDYTSTNPCDNTYHGTAAFSEPETQNVRWLLNAYPRIRWFVDIHSYSRLVLHVWGDDENQTTDPSMNFMNPAYDTVRGVRGDTAYKEYIPAEDLTSATGLANRMHDAIEAVRGENYTMEQSVDLYPTSGTSHDYVYSRHIVDPGKNKVHGFVIEWGTEFQPPWAEMENIILDISSGLVDFCLAAPCQGGLVDVVLDTPAINFNDVPEGETTARAAVFFVSSCGAVTFQITSGPTVTSGPPGTSFGTPLGTSVSLGVAATLDTRQAHVWISYTGTSNGDSADGTVTILCVETGDEWTIPITANTISRPTAAVMIALDKSDSMTYDSGFGAPLLTRNDLLKYSALPFVEVIHEEDALGIVTFDHDAHDVVPPMPPTLAGPTGYGAGRNTARNHILTHTPNPYGMTSIGDGVELAHARLTPVTGYDIKAILVFTDGHENRPKLLADVTDINDRVYAVGLGTAAEIQPAALTTLTNGTGGYLLLTGASDADKYFQLSKYFLQILAGVKNSDIIVDPEARIRLGQVHRVPFHLNEADITSDVILLTPAPWVIRFALETPAGDVIDPGVASATVGVDSFTGNNVAFYRLILPVPIGAAGAGPGKWTAVLTVDEQYWKRFLTGLKDLPAWYESVTVHGLRYALTVHAYSSLRLRVTLSQNSYEPGADLTLRAVLTEHGLPLETGAKVEAELTRPDHTATVLNLSEIDKGIFETAVTATLYGIYRFRIRARGTTLRGLPFTREQEVTGAVWKGGDNPPPSGKDDPHEPRERLCRLLACLLSRKTVSPELEKRLAELGLSLAGVRRCLKEFCASPPPESWEKVKQPNERLLKLATKLGPEALESLERIICEAEAECGTAEN